MTDIANRLEQMAGQRWAVAYEHDADLRAAAAEIRTHIFRMQDKRDPFRYVDFDPRAWNFIVVPILPDEAVVGYTNADQPSRASGEGEK